MREALYPADKYPGGHPDRAASIKGVAFLLNAPGEHAKALSRCTSGR